LIMEMSEQTVRTVFSRLDTDDDGVITKEDLLRSLGGSVTEEEMDAIFEQLGRPHGKLFFVDILQLMTDTRGRKVAGVGMLPGHSGVTTSDRVVKKKPALSQMGRSMTMSNVVLHSEASAANSDPMNEASRAKASWIHKGRSVQNLNRFLKQSSTTRADGASDSQREENDVSDPASQQLSSGDASPFNHPRRSSADGGVMADMAAHTVTGDRHASI